MPSSSKSSYDFENAKSNDNNTSVIGTKLNFIDSDSTSISKTYDNEDPKFSKIKFWFSWRMFIIFVVFLGVNLYNVMRTMIGVTMICMVNSTARAFAAGQENKFSLILNSTFIGISNFSRIEEEEEESVCRPSQEVRDEYTHGDLPWTVSQQTDIIAALNWAQLLITFPAGLMGDKYNIKWPLVVIYLIGAVCTFAVPLVGHLGHWYVVFLRACIGLCMGAVWPCLSVVVTRWIPASEISTMYAIVTGGNQLCMVFMMPLSTFLCKQRHLMGGWPLIYYLVALLTMVWLIFWVIFVTDHPDQNRFIGKDELMYLKSKLTIKRQEDDAGDSLSGRGGRGALIWRTMFGSVVGILTKTARHMANHLVTPEFVNRKPQMGPAMTTPIFGVYKARFRRPYKKLLFSPEAVSCVLCLTCGSFGIECLIYYLPAYLRDIMFVELATNGELSALPFLCQLICKLAFSRLADRLKASKKVNSNWIVKGFNTLGMFSMAIFTFSVTFLNCNHTTLVICMICIGTGLYSAVTPGFLASSMLIAPNHTAFLIAWMNFVSCFARILLPYMVGAVVVQSTVEEWRIIFALGSISQIFSGIVFLIFGKSKERNWAKTTPRSPPMIKEVQNESKKAEAGSFGTGVLVDDD